MKSQKLELVQRILKLIGATGRRPKLYFIRGAIWQEIRESFIDQSFNDLRILLGKPESVDYALSDPDCPYRNFLLIGIPICMK